MSLNKNQITTIQVTKETVTMLKEVCSKSETLNDLIKRLVLKYSKDIINEKSTQIQNLFKSQEK